MFEADGRITQHATETSLRLIIMQQVYRIFKQKESKLRETASAEGAIPALPAPGRSDVEVVRAEQSQAELTSSIEKNNASTKDDAGGNPLGWIWDSLPLGKTRSGDEEAPDRVGPTVAKALAQTAAEESASATTDSTATIRKASTLASSAVPVRGPHAQADTDIVREPEELVPDDDSASISAERVDELLPSRRDFALIASRRAELAITAALSVNSEFTAKEYLQHIGLKALLAGVVAVPRPEALSSRTSAVRAVNNLVRFHKPLAADLAGRSDIVNVLCDMMELPNNRFASLQSQEQKKRQFSAQHESVALVHRFVRSSEAAVEALRLNIRLRKTLATITQARDAGNLKPERARGAATWAANAVAELQSVREGKADVKKNMKTYKVRKQSNVTAVAEYDDLQLHQMAKVASWGLGGVQWKPRVPGQKGLRILSLDGGGTRGVLSIAFLKEILKRVNRNLEPYQMFDLICGTSTGGIIATLLGAQQASLAEAEVLYDAFIDKIFAQRSNLRLVTEQAAYDGRDWEKILYDMCGDQLLLDSNQHDCARVFCVSTKVNVNPPLPNLWRNYNYPPGQRARYPGACRVNTFTAIRATTAAPTFFTPVQWENGLYCDGALVANNPTAIALQEAKVRLLFLLRSLRLLALFVYVTHFLRLLCADAVPERPG
jgi:predicted patatin/cPLA2 family phospholipase